MTVNALSMRPAVRIAALWLALAGLVGVSVAAASPAHDHLNNPASTCSLCFVAHLAALQPGSPHVFFKLEYRGRAALPLSSPGYTPVCSDVYSTRGPPSR